MVEGGGVPWVLAKNQLKHFIEKPRGYTLSNFGRYADGQKLNVFGPCAPDAALAVSYALAAVYLSLK